MFSEIVGYIGKTFSWWIIVATVCLVAVTAFAVGGLWALGPNMSFDVAKGFAWSATAVGLFAAHVLVLSLSGIRHIRRCQPTPEEVSLVEKEEAVLAQMKAEQKESADFHHTLHCQIWPYRSLHFRTGDTAESVMLNGVAKAYWLDAEALRECSINDPVLQAIPVKVVEGQWEEHKTYRPFPNGRGQTYGYSIAEAEYTQRHEFFLEWGKGPWKWDVAAWDSAGVKLKDLFGQTITLPVSPDIIREVLSFVTGYDSVAHYALRAIGAKIVAAIVAAPANRELRLARVALMLGTDALEGRVFSEECWQGLAQRDPTKL